MPSRERRRPVDGQVGLEPLVLLVAVDVRRAPSGGAAARKPAAPTRTARSGRRPGACTGTGPRRTGRRRGCPGPTADRASRPATWPSLPRRRAMTWSAVTSRSSLAFRLTNIRPELRVPPPMNPAAFSTAGSWPTVSTNSVSRFLLGLERGVLVGDDRAGQPARVLLGEEALGDLDVEEDRGGHGRRASRPSSGAGAGGPSRAPARRRGGSRRTSARSPGTGARRPPCGTA